MPAAPQIPSPPTTANARGRVGLTRRQRDAISYLADNPDASYVEIKAALGVKSNESIRRLLGALEERGYIRRLPNRARAIEVLATVPREPRPIIIFGMRHRFIEKSRAGQADGDHAYIGPYPIRSHPRCSEWA